MQLDTEIVHQMWAFTGGVILMLLQSIVSGAKRNWWSLLIGCVLGGFGSWAAAQVFAGNAYIYLICGAAAVMTENILLGLFNASQQFRDSPIKVLTHLARTFLPTFGKSAGETSEAIKTDDLK